MLTRRQRRQRHPAHLNRRGLVVGGAVAGGGGLLLYLTANQSSSEGHVVGKAPLIGLLDRHALPPASGAWSWLFGGVCTLRWSDLQSGQGQPLKANNRIDQWVAATRSWNAAHPASPPRGFRVRLEPLTLPGDWPTTTFGPPVTVLDPADNASTQVGHFWTPPMIGAYDDLQRLAAAQYDSVPEVREVGLNLTGLMYAEPCRRYSFPALEAAGWTQAQDQAAMTAMIDAHRHWTQTPQFMAFNPYDLASGGTDETYTESLMTALRATFGSRAVLMNNSIRDTTTESAMYAKIKALGAPISFQTAAQARVGDLYKTIDFAVANGAYSLELPNQYQVNWDEATLKTKQAALVANLPHGYVGPFLRQEVRRSGGDRRVPAATTQRIAPHDRRTDPSMP